jgi:hypothetical protein
MKLNPNIDPDVDLQVDVTDLTTEFRRLPHILFEYYKYKANAEKQRDIAKARLKETRAQSYKRLKADVTTKRTEAGMEAEIDTDPAVLKAMGQLIQAEHDASTWQGAVESMKAKKDSLIQLGSDRRKEIS